MHIPPRTKPSVRLTSRSPASHCTHTPDTRRKPMSTPVTLPALGESVTEGTVTRWLKQVGDTVAVDEPLLEVSTDKVDTEIPSPVAGVLLEISANEDDTVEVGAQLCVIGDEGDGGGSAPAENEPAQEQPAQEAPAEEQPPQEAPAAQAPAEEAPSEEQQPAAQEQPAASGGDSSGGSGGESGGGSGGESGGGSGGGAGGGSGGSGPAGALARPGGAGHEGT